MITVWSPVLGRVQLLGMFHCFALIVNSLINWKLKLYRHSVYKVSKTQCMQFQPSARIRILENLLENVACPSPFWIQRLQSRGVSFKKLHFLPFLLLRNDTICTKLLCILSEYIFTWRWNKPQSVSKQQTSKFYGDFVHFFSNEMAEHQSMGHLDSHIIFNRALFARQSCAKSKRIPFKLQRASYRAQYWVTTAQNWCRVSATEIGCKIAKTTQDVKMFNVL